MTHVMISPCEVYEISTGINRDQAKGRVKIRVGTSGKGEKTYSAINIMACTAGSIVGNKGGRRNLQKWKEPRA